MQDIKKGSAIKCPVCNHNFTRVVYTRTSYSHAVATRRRECLGCRSKFSTIETVRDQESKK